MYILKSQFVTSRPNYARARVTCRVYNYEKKGRPHGFPFSLQKNTPVLAQARGRCQKRCKVLTQAKRADSFTQILKGKIKLFALLFIKCARLPVYLVAIDTLQ